MEWIWILSIALVIIIAIGGYLLYRKKKQYDFVLKMMKKNKEIKKEQQKQAEFEQKMQVKSETEASGIVESLGGIANIAEISQCAIRLRVIVKDANLVNQKQLKQNGVSGIIKTVKSLQLIVGDRAEDIYQEIISLQTEQN